MSQMDSPIFGRGIEDKNHLPVFHHMMLQKLQDCGVSLPEKAKGLEVGSGNGNFLNHLRENGLDIEGVDIKPRGPEVKEADIAALPYSDELFDYVLSKQVFDGWLYDQDVEKQKAMLREIVRVLKKGGVYYAMESFFEPIEGLELIPDPKGNRVSSVYKKV